MHCAPMRGLWVLWALRVRSVSVCPITHRKCDGLAGAGAGLLNVEPAATRTQTLTLAQILGKMFTRMFMCVICAHTYTCEHTHTRTHSSVLVGVHGMRSAGCEYETANY